MKVKLKEITKVCCDGDWIESKDQSSEGIRLIQTGNIGEGFFLNKESRAKYISFDTFEKLKCTEVYEGDILVSRLPDPIGRSCIIPPMEQKMITAVDCTIIRCDESLCLPKYFVYFSRSKFYQFQVNQLISGATRQRISRKNLENIEINIPSLFDQQQIVFHLDTIQSAIDNKQQQLKELDELVKSRFIEMNKIPHGFDFANTKSVLREVA